MRCWLLPILIVLCGPMWSQSIFISYFRPGSYLTSNDHRIVLSNSGNQSINLTGYMLVTRDYSVRMPEGSKIKPGGTFRVEKSISTPAGADLYLSETPDFLIRFHMLSIEGNYAVLIDREDQVVDAFYFSPSPNVPFLPDRDTCIAFDGTRIPYYIPPENRDVWDYLSTSSDPGIAFMQEDGKWEVTDSDDTAPPPTNYRDLNVRYFDGIVTIKWATDYEMVMGQHVLEKSTDQINFQPVGAQASQGENENFQYYTFYDKEVAEDQVYYYRIRHEFREGSEVYSRIKSVQTQSGVDEFSMEVILVPKGNQTELNLRFRSEYSQDIRIKLLDDRMAEVAILFDDFVFAGNSHLLKVNRPLPPGKYLVLTSTETKRFGKEVLVQK